MCSKDFVWLGQEKDVFEILGKVRKNMCSKGFVRLGEEKDEVRLGKRCVQKIRLDQEKDVFKI